MNAFVECLRLPGTVLVDRLTEVVDGSYLCLPPAPRFLEVRACLCGSAVVPSTWMILGILTVQ